jgi:hypothetical protein
MHEKTVACDLTSRALAVAKTLTRGATDAR